MTARTSFKRLAIVAAWLVIWQCVALLVNNHILLAGPLEVVGTLARDAITVEFWSSIGFSFVRIVSGFLAAFIVGVVVGALAGRFRALEEFLEPALQFIKSVPIVCIIVLLLLWFGSPLVSAAAVFLVAFPVIYFAVVEALRARNTQLQQMLKLFQVKTWRRILAYNWPSMLPFLISASRVAVGMSWKAGVAAELIGLPLGSIGESIYHAKLTFSSAELFSWTLVIVLISILCERAFLHLLKRSEAGAWQLALPRLGRGKGADVALQEPRGTSVEPAPLVSSNEDGHELQGKQDLSALPKTAARLSDVSVSFGNQRVLNDLSLTLLAGERYALRGISGSGKTTLLAVLEGIIAPDTGTVETSGKISAVFQDTRLFEQHSALENVQLVAGHAVSLERITRVLQELLPADSLNKPVSELSGGMRRRVELTRALVLPSETLLLDEPFAGLDDESRAQAGVVIVRELGGRTLVVATHDKGDELALGLTPLTLPSAESILSD